MKEEHFFGQVTQKVILKYKNSFVIVKEKGQDEWILPGGRLNVDEQLEEGLIREIKEELGVDCVDQKLISVSVSHNIHKIPKVFIFYTASVVSDQEIKINHEISDFVLVSKKEDLEKYLMYSNQKEVLEKFLIL